MSTLWRLTYRGNMPAGDVFAHGLHATGVDGMSSTDALATAVAGLTALMSGAGGMQTLFSTTLVYAEVVAELVDQFDGHVISSRTQALSRPGTDSTGRPLPNNVALAVTTRTATAGRRGRGRFFLPAPSSVTLSTTGQLATTSQTTINAALDNFFAALTGATHALTPVVFSRTGHAFHTITQYDVGSIFDTQERRRNKLTEARVGNTV